jgi:dethiobiotin synthetase/malonyl-CoA O-methyltransferase
MSAIFVTGTDTGIGKTLVSAWLVHHWRAYYWKPIQTGIIEDDESATVARLADAPPSRILPNEVALDAPLSPMVAASRQGMRITLDRFSPPPQRPLVVEGAGGILVPVNERDFMVDLMARLGLPVLVVARSTLGTINHTLLTLEALRRRGLAVRGVILNGPRDPDNRAAIEKLGEVRVLAELPPLDQVDANALRGLPAPEFQ